MAVRGFLVLTLLLVSGACAASAQGPVLPKDQRTAAQRKLDSRLLQEIDAERAGKKDRPADEAPLAVQFDKEHRALVDIRTEATQSVRTTVIRLGGAIQSTSVEHRSVLAWMPLLKLEELAGSVTVRSIVSAPQATINR